MIQKFAEPIGADSVFDPLSVDEGSLQKSPGFSGAFFANGLF
jgi:hypothetical protein